MTGAQSEEDGILGELNVTPLVDVALVLVIIFMVTAPLLRQPSLEVSLPKSASQETKDPVQFAVTMAPDGRLALNERIVPETALLAQLEGALATSPDALVVLRADRATDAALVVALAKRLREAGATRIAIGTDHAQSSEPRRAPWPR